MREAMERMYEKGEEVIYYGKLKESRGVSCKVVDIRHRNDRFPCTLEPELPRAGFAYKLDDTNISKKWTINGIKYSEYIIEESLRPKPKGNGKTITEFMGSLKKGELEHV